MQANKMKEKYLQLERTQFQAFTELPIDSPLYMYNLLKYKEKVEGSDLTGENAYRDYMRAATPFFQQAQATVLFFGSPEFVLIGEEQDAYWDDILLVKYDSKNDFLGMITAEGYPAELRELALEDSRLIYCKSKNLKTNHASKG